MPMHVGSLMLLNKPKKRGYDFHTSVLDLVAERLPKARALKRKLIEAPLELAHPMWGEAAEIDLSEHIRRESLPAPGSEAQLLRRVGELHSQLLPRDRPLWRLTVIEGLASGQIALYSKIHHALLDGQGGIALATALLDIEAKIPKAAEAHVPSEPDEVPGTRARAGTAMRATASQFAKLIRALPATFSLARKGLSEAGSLLGKLRDTVLLAPRTPYNVNIGGERAFAIASVDLGRVKRIAKAHGVSLNDVVLAMVAHAVREHLKRAKALPDEAMVVAMPISLRGSGDGEANNQVSMAQCALPTHLVDPVERLRAIHLATMAIKNRVAAFKDLIPTDFPGLAAPIWAAGLSRLWARAHISERLPPLANVVVSNVPGPPVRLFLAGAELQNYYPVSIVTHGLALNFTLQSYCGSLDFGVIAAKDVVPRPDTLARALVKALDVLEARTPKHE
jgi:WS/DGAT/MGAT family acyltransferase